MARPLNNSTKQNFVAEWSAKLRMWSDGPSGGDADRLAAVLNENAALLGRERIRFQKASKTLREALPKAVSGESADVDDWITRHLMQPGRDNLLVEAERVRAIARARDAVMREEHGKQHLVSARVQLPMAVWRRLDQIKAELRAQTRAEALTALIEGRKMVAEIQPGDKAKGKSRPTAVKNSQAVDRQPDLPLLRLKQPAEEFLS